MYFCSEYQHKIYQKTIMTKFKLCICLMMVVLSCVLIGNIANIVDNNDIVGILLVFGLFSVLYWGYKFFAVLITIIDNEDNHPSYYDGGHYNLANNKKSKSISTTYKKYLTQQNNSTILINELSSEMEIKTNISVQPMAENEQLDKNEKERS